MEKIKQILPQNFEIINEINYFRLEDGQIAVENTKNVTIDSSKEDIIELITLEYDSNIIRFWRTNGKLYALASSSCITIPEDITFVGCYSSNNYPEGQYVKYISSGRCGIMYVSETEISQVISYEQGYIEIYFENNLFYADLKEGDNKYHVIGESGKLLGTFPSRCRKLDGYMLFYSENKIFIGSLEYEILDGILSVKVINNGILTFVRVVNSKGIYYYTKEMSYLLGPIKEDQIESIDKNSCYVYEVAGEKTFSVFYIEFTDGTYLCKSICCKKGIKIYSFYDCEERFFVFDKTVYVFIKKEFNLLIKDVDVEEYTFYSPTIKKSDRNRRWEIVGFKKGEPTYYALYYKPDKEVRTKGALDIICTGWGIATYICKSGCEIMVITREGEIKFLTTGQNCYKKKRIRGVYCSEIYIVEKEDEEIEIYFRDGTKY